MATATGSDMTVPLLGGRHHFLLRRLHSLTGIVFGGYLVVHLLVNATIAQLGTHYQVQVNKIHDLPLLEAVEWTFIFLPIIYHTLYGIWIILTGQPNVGSYPYAKNWYYLLQRISAVIIVLFMLFHVLTLKAGIAGHDSRLTFDYHNAAWSVHQHFQVNLFITWFVYPIGILASCYHLANGFWTAAITWGLTVSAAAQRRFGYVCTALFAITFVFGMSALIAGATFDIKSIAPTANVNPAGIQAPTGMTP